jgi:hypothetical protein
VQLDRENQAHRDLYSSVKRGDIDAMSFAFCVPENGDEWQGNARTLRNVDLRDVAIVTDPAYPGTSATARSKKDDDDIDPDGDSNDSEDIDECECDCDECKDGRCAECSNEECEDDDCNECPHRPDPDDLRARLDAVKV